MNDLMYPIKDHDRMKELKFYLFFVSLRKLYKKHKIDDVREIWFNHQPPPALYLVQNKFYPMHSCYNIKKVPNHIEQILEILLGLKIVIVWVAVTVTGVVPIVKLHVKV